MNTRRVLACCALLAALAGLVSAQTAPRIVVGVPVKDAGVVGSGETIRETFVLGNEGDAELRILGVEPDCGCTIVSFDRTIAPGATGVIAAEVDVATFVGPIAKFLQVRTNDAATPQLTLTIKAEVRPEIRSYPGYARFLTVVGEEELTSEQTVWASEFENFEVRAARSPFPFLDVQIAEATKDEERQEGRGRQWRVVMTLSKDAPVGPMADRVRLVTNHPDHRSVFIPVSGFVRPVLAVNPPVVNVGERDGEKAIVASAEVKNFTDEEIALLSVSTEQPGIDVEIRPKGRDHYLIITLRPGLEKGPFNAVLTVQTDSARVPTLEVEVTGTIL